MQTVLMALGVIATPIIILGLLTYILWPVAGGTGMGRRVSGISTGIIKIPPLIFFVLIVGALSPYKGIVFAVKQLNALTKQKPRDLAPVLVWFVLAALLFKPLFGNSFSINGWKNAFDEPAGFLVYITISIVALILIVSAVRSGMLLVSGKWKSVALRSTITLVIIGGIGYFLFYSLTNDYSKNSANDTEQQPANTASLSREFETELLGYASAKFFLEPGATATITETARNLKEVGSVSGKWYETTLWGYKDRNVAEYFGGRNNNSHCYADKKGVMGGETVVVLGEPCVSQEIYQFPDGQKTLSVENKGDSTIAVSIYYHIARNYGLRASDFTGSAKFSVKIKN